MNDDRIWEFETELWTGSADAYDRKVADDCVMALPADPWLLSGAAARQAVKDTPRWDSVEFSDTHIAKPEHGLIVIAYRAQASRGSENYDALCTSTLQRVGEEDWQVVQHQQTPLDVKIAKPDG
ncbi:DUF4440 domain-containing protein [Pontixanthobacter sp.]|uniref:DUF4440 domain-containing protein n=1 Tax=Pontixanthobacter sp. TaxID=2792078 RepID=UPI003C7BFB8C